MMSSETRYFPHRALVLVLLSTVAVFLAPVSPATAVGTFADDDESIFQPSIEWMAVNGITKGCNPPVNDEFCPDQAVTRGQMAAFLVRAFGYSSGGGSDLFVDDDDSIFEDDIDRLGTAGVTKGCNPPVNDEFCPDQAVTRGELAAFLHRALADSEPTHDPADIAVFGTVESVAVDSFTLRQAAFDVVPTGDAKIEERLDNLAAGEAGDLITIRVREGTVYSLGGESAEFSAITVDMHLIALGRLDGEVLVADAVGSTDEVAPPPEDTATISAPVSSYVATEAWAAVSLCMGQDMAYDDDPASQEFQGCFAGPSAKDEWDTWIPMGVIPFVGMWVIDSVGYVAALAGWGFDFPHKFEADGALTYHVPGTVAVDVKPLPATGVESTFTGGIGIDVFIEVSFCAIWGRCYNVGSPTLGVLPSQLYESAEPAPRWDETLDVQELTCPGIGLEIPDTPISLVAIEACQDMSFDGAPFSAWVSAGGGSQWLDFGRSAPQVSVTPDAESVMVSFEQFNYAPELNNGMYLRLAILNGLKTWRLTPTAWLTHTPFYAITTPFPLSGSLMTLATDPNSPIDDLWYLEQPTRVDVVVPVAPAATTLEFAERDHCCSVYQVLLAEEYDASPIADAVVTFTAGDYSVDVVTDAEGVASAHLPPWVHKVDASYVGSAVYLPSAAHYDPCANGEGGSATACSEVE